MKDIKWKKRVNRCGCYFQVWLEEEKDEVYLKIGNPGDIEGFHAISFKYDSFGKPLVRVYEGTLSGLGIMVDKQ